MNGTVCDVPELESTQQQADTRVILYTVFSHQKEGAERVVIYANDTDVTVTLIYYAATLLKDLSEMWVRTIHTSYLPVLQMASV